VWLGSQAQPQGLVDRLGGLDQAIELVKQKAKIPASENVTLVMYPPRRSIFDVLFKTSTDTVIESRLHSLLKDWPTELWLRGGMLRVMPFGVTVQ
jgi:protease-4